MKLMPIILTITLTFALSAAEFNLGELDKHMHAADFFAADKYLNSFPADSRDPDVIISRGWLALSWGFKTDVGDGLALENGQPFPSGFPSYEQKLKLRTKGKTILEQAIKDFPERIDARFNMVGYYLRMGQFSNFKSASVAILILSRTKDHKWKNRGGVSIPEPDEFVLGNLQANMVDLQKIDSREAEAVYIDVAKAMTEFAPKHVYGYNNLGLIYKMLDKPKIALPYILKAHELDPQDIIVMGNLTQTYIVLGDKEKARETCKKMIAHPSGQFRSWAEKKLQELQ